VEGAANAVAVVDGAVTLTGVVRAEQKAVVERIAASVSGVRVVRNDLVVSNTIALSDERIAALIVEALAADAALPTERIVVGVVDGIVDSTGEVDGARDRQVAERVALDIPGAVDVRNRIIVRGVGVSVEEVMAAVERALVGSVTADIRGLSMRDDG
jgi:osmotically-inducible protein OsmY